MVKELLDIDTKDEQSPFTTLINSLKQMVDIFKEIVL